jgi:predicted amidohydrolase YtcJ
VTRTLLVAAGVHPFTGDDRAVRALLVDGETIAWTGGADDDRPPADRVIDLAGAWITPAFVDAHVHGTAAGLGLSGLELSDCASAAACLARVREHARRLPAGRVVAGTGWDDFTWPEGRPPTAAEVGAAAGNRTVLLMRVDGHSCVVDPGTLAGLPLHDLDGVDRDHAGEPTGWLREQASEAAQALVRSRIPPVQLAAAREATCRRAVALGIASLHEMGHPGLSGLDDTLAWAAGEWPVEVIAWWAELDLDAWRRHGLRPGGDLFLDGSIGSCTAATSVPYRCGDGRTTGTLFHDDDAVAAFFADCTREGIGAGVHAIGDRAIDQAVGAIATAAGRCGAERVRACRHRIEHAELARPGHIERMAALGVVASMQPAFDAAWGGGDGLYAARFGAEAARATNPVGRFADAGVALAFSSDVPVTPLDPWGTVAAAQQHRGGWGLDRRRALAAHTLGGRDAAGQTGVGPLRAGMRADLAIWSADPLTADDVRDLHCLATLVRGVPKHGDLSG